MKKSKIVMALAFALCMVVMSGTLAFADAEADTSDSTTYTNTAADTSAVEETKKDAEVIDESTGGEAGEAGEDNKATQTEQKSVLNYVSAKVFLRYSNEVPANILQDFAPESFGPAGTNSPYFTVEVDLNKIETLCGQGYIKKDTFGEYVYYSAQETLKPEQPVTKEAALSCWNAVLQAVSEDDKQKFIEYFGVSGVARTPNFIGYVFKLETDGWHIDGILDVKPGYVTEFYLNDEIKKTDVASAAMTTNTAKGNIEEQLGAVSGTIKWNDDGMGGTYKQGDEFYQFKIQPDGDYSASDKNVRYATKIKDSYYLATIYVITEKIPEKPKAAVYEIRYYLQQTDGTYKIVDREFPLYAGIGAFVTAPQKEFEGYTFNADRSNPTDTVIEPIAGTDEDPPKYLVLNMYYDIKPSEPSVGPVEPTPDPVDPTPGPVEPMPDPVYPTPGPVDPQPLPPDDPLIEPVDPQPLPPDDPLIEPVDPQPLPDDEHLIDPTDAEKTTDPDQPKTGDKAPLMSLCGLFFAAAGALGAICIRRRGKKIKN